MTAKAARATLRLGRLPSGARRYGIYIIASKRTTWSADRVAVMKRIAQLNKEKPDGNP